LSDVFISRVEEDGDIALEIAQALEAAGYTAWSYERDAVPGPSYLIQTGRAVEDAQAVVLLISPHSLGSHQVTKEVVRAHESGKPFIPVLRDISHVEFQQRQPEWREAVGAAASTRIPPEGASAVLPRIIEGLKMLGIHPSVARPPAKPSPRRRAPAAKPSPQQAPAASEGWEPVPAVLAPEVAPALIRTLVGHTGFVHDCAVSPDGSFIVSAGGHTLKVWDAATGRERATLAGHTEPVYACAISPDGSFIVSASRDNTLKVWDAAKGQERATLTGHTDLLKACAVSPDGSFIVSAGADKTLKVWDAATARERATLASGQVNGCAVSPDSSFIVSASADNTLKIWDARTGRERASLTGHERDVNACAISPDCSFIVSGSEDKTLKVWDARTLRERATLAGHSGPVNGCAVSPDGSFIVSASGDRTLKVWDARTLRERASLPPRG
jgi:hypothetical protein